MVNCFKATPILKTNPSEGSNEFRLKGIRKNNSSLSSSPLPCSPSKWNYDDLKCQSSEYDSFIEKSHLTFWNFKAKALTNVFEDSEPEESKVEDPSAIIKFDLGLEESI